MLNQRFILLFIFALCASATAYAFYAQIYLSIMPCPLCVVQRIMIIAIGIFSFIFAIHNPKNILIKIYSLIIIVLGVITIKIAAHHLWLINLPEDKKPFSCGLPLDVLYKRLPINNFVKYILNGDAECTHVNWTIFGLSSPTTVIILCGAVLLLSLYILFKKI